MLWTEQNYIRDNKRFMKTFHLTIYIFENIINHICVGSEFTFIYLLLSTRSKSYRKYLGIKCNKKNR